jgi:hypothetical protein
LAKFSGTPEEMIAYNQGVADERDRMLKILTKYHSTFGKTESLEVSDASMLIKYMYNFIVESRPVK